MIEAWSFGPWELAGAALIGACSRAGARLPVSVRLAVRDAARHRHRTGPATSAIAVAVAGSVLLAFLLAGTFRAEELKHVPDLPAQVLGVSPGDAAIATARRAAQRAAAVLPDARTLELRWVQRPFERGEQVPSGIPKAELGSLNPDFPADRCQNGCSGGGPLALAGGAELNALAAGGELDAAGRAALRRGEVVIFDARAVRDGRVTIRFGVHGDRLLRLPAHVAARAVAYSSLPSGLVPPSTARAQGWDSTPGQLLVPFGDGATQDQLDAAVGAVEDLGAMAALEQGGATRPSGLLLAIAGIAGFVTLVGVAISVALSAAEGRADLATLAAVGAPPSRRRALAASQALLVAGVGCGLGLALGSFVAFAARATTGSPEFVVPWANLAITGLAVPLAAVVVAALGTPSRLPLVRRIA